MATFVLLFGEGVGIGILGQRFVPCGAWTASVALLAVLAGLGLAAWARLRLGRHWAGSVALHSEHALVRTGPYAHLRHPIYVGLLLAISGTAVAEGEVRGLAAVVVGWLAYRRKARMEDRWLAGHFGAAYEEYARTVPSGLGTGPLAT